MTSGDFNLASLGQKPDAGCPQTWRSSTVTESTPRPRVWGCLVPESRSSQES